MTPPPPFSFSVGPVDTSVENPGKNTEIEDNAYIIFFGGGGGKQGVVWEM